MSCLHVLDVTMMPLYIFLTSEEYEAIYFIIKMMFPWTLKSWFTSQTSSTKLRLNVDFCVTKCPKEKPNKTIQNQIPAEVVKLIYFTKPTFDN